MANTPPPEDWEDEFFKKHNVTDEEDKKAIRGRSTVLAYDRARQKAEEAEANKGRKKGRFFDD